MRNVTPDRQKAIALQKMAKVTLQRIQDTPIEKYPSNILKDYYDVIHELMEALMALWGKKESGEGAHQKLIDYVTTQYQELQNERIFLQEMREYRNKIAYEGLSIDTDYLTRNKERIRLIIELLHKKIEEDKE